MVLFSLIPFIGACTTYHTAGEKFYQGEWNTFLQSMEESLRPGVTTMEQAKKFFPTEPMSVTRNKDNIIWFYLYRYDETTKTSKVFFNETRQRGDRYLVALVFDRNGILVNPESTSERIVDFLQEPMTETIITYAVVGGAIVVGGMLITNSIGSAIDKAAADAAR